MAASVLLDTNQSAGYIGPGVSSFALNVSTTGPNRLIVLLIDTFGPAVALVASAGLEWTRRDNSAAGTELWTAPAAAQQTSASVTVTLAGSSGQIHALVDTYNVAGAASIPTVGAVRSTNFPLSETPSGSVTTGADNATVAAYIRFSGDPTESIGSAGSGYVLTGQHVQIGVYVIGGEIATSDTAVSGTTVSAGFSLNGTSSSGNVILIALGGSAAASPAISTTIFSSGTLFATPAGGGSIEFALVQDIAVYFTGQRKTLYDAPQVSRYPADVGFHGRMAYMQAVNAAFKADALQLLLGSVQSGSGPIMETLAKTITLPTFSAVLTTQDTSGKQQVWTFGNVRAAGVDIPFKLENFAMPQFAMTAYPDSSGALATIQTPQ